MDDIFAVIPEFINTDEFLDKLNNLHHSMKFKVEIEDENGLPFLDTMVTRSLDNKARYKVYRKPTNSESYIHAFSYHSDNVKLGVLSNMFLRAYKICDMEFLDSEINHIKEVFHKHGYRADFIKKAHSRAKRTFYGNQEKKEFLRENETLLVLPETKLSNRKVLNNYLSKCNIKTVFRNTNNIKQYFHKKNNNSEEIKAAIYEISCQDCPKTYIGETIDFERRKRQHNDSLRRGDKNSALFQHRNEYNHKIQTNNMRRIVNIKNVEKRKLLESILIHNTDNYDIYRSNFNLDLFSNAILTKHVVSVNKLLNDLKRPP